MVLLPLQVLSVGMWLDSSIPVELVLLLLLL
jgi:hypothetical protein